MRSVVFASCLIAVAVSTLGMVASLEENQLEMESFTENKDISSLTFIPDNSCDWVCGAEDYTWIYNCYGSPDGNNMVSLQIGCYGSHALECDPAYNGFVLLHVGPCSCLLQPGPQKDGGCLTEFKFYYYNVRNSKCEEATYSQCGPKSMDNLFGNYDECTKTCSRNSGACNQQQQTCTYDGGPHGKRSGLCSSQPIAGLKDMGELQCAKGCKCYVLGDRYCVPGRHGCENPQTCSINVPGFGEKSGLCSDRGHIEGLTEVGKQQCSNKKNCKCYVPNDVVTTLQPTTA